jgi:PKHD-type hydroxylase
MIHIFDMLPSGIVKNLNDFYQFCEFTDGSWSGSSDKKVKHNQQILDEVHYPSMVKLMDQQISSNKYLNYIFLPKGHTHPNFLRYVEGMHYDWHYDNFILDQMRTDYSVTVFLNDPDEYEGGELEIKVGDSLQQFKLNAGQAVIYHTGLHHRVKPVTKGERRVVTWWMNSMIDNSSNREILVDLSKVLLEIGNDPMRGRLETIRCNLIRTNATI